MFANVLIILKIPRVRETSLCQSYIYILITRNEHRVKVDYQLLSNVYSYNFHNVFREVLFTLIDISHMNDRSINFNTVENSQFICFNRTNRLIQYCKQYFKQIVHNNGNSSKYR